MGLLIHSPVACNHWHWVQEKPGAWNSIRVSHYMARVQIPELSPAISQEARYWEAEYMQMDGISTMGCKHPK